MSKPLIGFIGQGWIGKHYADDFEERGHEVVRYGLEPEFAGNKDRIKDCRIVFIAVPTPTKVGVGFDASVLREVVKLVGKGNVAVIKSTLLPGTTRTIQSENPDITVLHSPEFLTEKTAAHDARHPNRNIVGMASETAEDAARLVMEVLPKAPFELVCGAEEAEAIKYGGNCWFYLKVLFMNTLFDLCKARGIDFQTVTEGMAADPRVGPTHLQVEHQGGRGAGGHCFIKDFAAYQGFYLDTLKGLAGADAKDDQRHQLGNIFLIAAEHYNVELLKGSGKDLDLLEGVYGKQV